MALKLAMKRPGKGFFEVLFAGSVVTSSELSTRISIAATSEGSNSSSRGKGGAKGGRADQLRYMTDNYDVIMRDAASGGGEHLGAFTHLLGCSGVARPRVFARAKDQFHRIFPDIHGDSEVNVEATLIQFKRVLAEDADLAARCSRLTRAPRSSPASIHHAGLGCCRAALPGSPACHPQPL